jgi:hypothetical protein
MSEVQPLSGERLWTSRRAGEPVLEYGWLRADREAMSGAMYAIRAQGGSASAMALGDIVSSVFATIGILIAQCDGVLASSIQVRAAVACHSRRSSRSCSRKNEIG